MISVPAAAEAGRVSYRMMLRSLVVRERTLVSRVWVPRFLFLVARRMELGMISLVLASASFHGTPSIQSMHDHYPFALELGR
jgi:hypothetical protein